MGIFPGGNHGSGSGSSLPPLLLTLAGLSTIFAVVVSAISVFMHLKNYRKPVLQRMVIRIMIMVPLYAIASLISLFSLEAAFAIDVIRDIYEAFVIYCFFELLCGYLGGERSLLILLHGRPPKDAVFPATLFRSEIDVSDPYTFLFLKRGILQYVQLKPILAVVTLILKACGKYNEGDLRGDSGYLYISIVYNFSICLALYCLAVFWMCVSDDLKPFRPMPKFLCVKGILFFSFWQAIGISILVKLGAITKLGPYTDSEHISLGLTDLLICLEMPIFAMAHSYAFSYTDFLEPKLSWVARMPILYAMRDAFGIRDVIEDGKNTLSGERMDYREFEPSEGYIHQGLGRERRIRAGLRYADGGRKKYWLPRTTEETDRNGPPALDPPIPGAEVAERAVSKAWHKFGARVGAATALGTDEPDDVYAPLLEEDADDVIHLAPDLASPTAEEDALDLVPGINATAETDKDAYLLPFGEVDEADEALFDHARRYVFGDYNYPVIDCSSEQARQLIWDEEERILSDARGAYFSPIRGPGAGPLMGERKNAFGGGGYGATGVTGNRARIDSNASASSSRGARAKTANGKSKVQEKIIDHEDERTAAVESGDVRLKWTKGQRHAHFTPPAVSRAGSGSGSGSDTPRPMSRTNSSRSGNANTPMRSPPMSPRDDSKRPVLPPDAVDLVVEDKEAEDEATRDHRKGEPASHNFRKVYRRGYAVEDEDGQKRDFEVEEGRSPARKGNDIDEVEEDERRIVQEVAEENPVVQTIEEVPAHARLLDRLPSDDNPWA